MTLSNFPQSDKIVTSKAYNTFRYCHLCFWTRWQVAGPKRMIKVLDS